MSVFPDIASVAVVRPEGRYLLVPVGSEVYAYIGGLYGISALPTPIDVFADVHTANILSVDAAATAYGRIGAGDDAADRWESGAVPTVRIFPVGGGRVV